MSVAFGLFLKFAEDELGDGKAWAIVLTVIFVIIMSLLLISLGCQPQNQAIITFKVRRCSMFPNTVQPMFKDHLREENILVFVHRWLSITGSFMQKMSNMEI